MNEQSPMHAIMKGTTEDGRDALTDFAFLPEGRLICAVLENAFTDMGIAQRAIIRKSRVRYKNRRSTTGWAQRLMADTAWVMSNDMYWMSFRWCMEAIATDPEGFGAAVRRAWIEHMNRGGYLAPKARNPYGYKRREAA